MPNQCSLILVDFSCSDVLVRLSGTFSGPESGTRLYILSSVPATQAVRNLEYNQFSQAKHNTNLGISVITFSQGSDLTVTSCYNSTVSLVILSLCRIKHSVKSTWLPRLPHIS